MTASVDSSFARRRPALRARSRRPLRPGPAAPGWGVPRSLLLCSRLETLGCGGDDDGDGGDGGDAMVVINSPADGEIAGPDGVALTFTLSPGADAGPGTGTPALDRVVYDLSAGFPLSSGYLAGSSRLERMAGPGSLALARGALGSLELVPAPVAGRAPSRERAPAPEGRGQDRSPSSCGGGPCLIPFPELGPRAAAGPALRPPAAGRRGGRRAGRGPRRGAPATGM